jgi:hypothetical protein
MVLVLLIHIFTGSHLLLIVLEFILDILIVEGVEVI